MTCPGHGFVTGDYVRLYNCRSNPGPSPRGQYQVTFIDANNFTIVSNAPTPGLVLNAGTCRKILGTVVPYRDAIFTAVCKRKTGGIGVKGRVVKKKFVG